MSMFTTHEKFEPLRQEGQEKCHCRIDLCRILCPSFIFFLSKSFTECFREWVKDHLSGIAQTFWYIKRKGRKLKIFFNRILLLLNLEILSFILACVKEMKFKSSCRMCSKIVVPHPTNLTFVLWCCCCPCCPCLMRLTQNLKLKL